MFQMLYEVLCGAHPNPAYAEEIYPFVGVFTLIAAGLFAFLFYVVLGRMRPIWDKTSHWSATLVLLLLIAFLFSRYHAEAVTEDMEPFVYRFALVNLLYAAIYYLLFSLAFKKLSIYAKRTPF
ncbi:hypothetical protein SAMN05216327_10249 [Dyadobacter sp. SG02]|uniref:hypothetical protein n=1 Tax=Dyadobacter sp. SG02 TaxID=1855291 RepID=UPI0008B83661|nr:hypothetical protein [Dyadobacter sp. SG02]SEI49902.1 hypothetical protein SAMN05216327_10249 [Dyadobacter sp. SG02]